MRKGSESLFLVTDTKCLSGLFPPSKKPVLRESFRLFCSSQNKTKKVKVKRRVFRVGGKKTKFVRDSLFRRVVPFDFVHFRDVMSGGVYESESSVLTTLDPPVSIFPTSVGKEYVSVPLLVYDTRLTNTWGFLQCNFKLEVPLP